MLEEVKSLLEQWPIVQITFSVMLAIGCFWIMMHADRTRRTQQPSFQNGKPEGTELYFDGPIMATYRMVREIKETTDRAERRNLVISEMLKLRQDRENELWSDAFRMLREIKDGQTNLYRRR